ncbi:MAG: hypothetical protein N2D54_07930, partial [Chloroflexota bacterium]
MKIRISLVSVISVLVLVLTACGAGDGNSDINGGNADNDNADAPHTINLSSIGVIPEDSPNYIKDMVIMYSGVDLSGNPTTAEIEAQVHMQVEPVKAFTNTMIFTTSEGVNKIDSAVIDGTNYSYMAEGGCFVLAADLLVTGIEDALDVDNTLINQAELLEPGVIVNGVITDAYAITADNIADTEIEDLNISSGTVFVARER